MTTRSYRNSSITAVTCTNGSASTQFTAVNCAPGRAMGASCTRLWRREPRPRATRGQRPSRRHNRTARVAPRAHKGVAIALSARRRTAPSPVAERPPATHPATAYVPTGWSRDGSRGRRLSAGSCAGLHLPESRLVDGRLAGFGVSEGWLVESGLGHVGRRAKLLCVPPMSGPTLSPGG